MNAAAPEETTGAHSWRPSRPGGLTERFSLGAQGWRLRPRSYGQRGSEVTRPVSPFSRFSDMLACERLLSSLLFALHSPFYLSTRRTARTRPGSISEWKEAIHIVSLLFYDPPATAIPAMQGQKNLRSHAISKRSARNVLKISTDAITLL